ncbi:nucleotidyltransferase domain-containing protein [Microbacterium sp. zg.Y625]|uniref:nucleotidyltransferase domain-containing protein n=1 Tax=Microbacterium jiangjiandongii TaxID=3049071 RepID=UPI00214A8F18|nr:MULTISPECIES: nucleotidyltransferase domain-containing protein [unclassified Microbacterium]MCR2794259.1 nucleotidyltransferase domain-containing protein [Microbacterium sp. zg.Y625]WIM25448.1 nucleotidyltransferase domain-containing protein [Microbacterium sp. zg-Y625]
MIGARWLQEMAGQLAAVDGVLAVALGGSRARNTHRPDSDVDLGLYYERETLDLGALEDLARRWAGRRVEVAAPGSWGPWVDGGAWLTVNGTDVDWILRDVERVREQCHRARRGQFGFHAQAGHPLGFLDVAYAGEAATAVPLVDAGGVLAGLRELVTPYPEALRAAMIDNLWQVDFFLDGALKGAKRGDAAYVALSASHAVLLVAHAWHAAAGEWATNEKGLTANVARLAIESHGFAEIATRSLAYVGRRPAELVSTLTDLKTIPRPTGDVRA